MNFFYVANSVISTQLEIYKGSHSETEHSSSSTRPSSRMSSVPTNSTTSPDKTTHPSSSSAHHQPEPQNTIVPTLLDDLLSDVPMDFDFERLNPGVNALLAPPSQVPPYLVNDGPQHQHHMAPETPPIFHALPQPPIPLAIFPGIVHPLTFGTFDGLYPLYPFPYPNTVPMPFLASSGAAVFDPGDRAPLSSITNPSIPMVSLAAPPMAPAPGPSSSATQRNPEPERAPVSGLQMDVLAAMPTVAAGNANATATVTAGSAGAATRSTAAGATFAGAGDTRAPVSRCSCCHRVNPLIRVDDTIEWVRPGVMKMVVWFNWTSNAEAEAQESWEAREA
ncbi:hypothetical protein BC827DRAFT_1238665 [Russula dissimulans]|nr:hypothetical protein BC827DRAFT_1238665 [Russula dissimulans]